MAMFGSNSTVLVGKWGQETRTTGVVDEVEDSCSMSGFDRSSLFAQRAKGLFPDFGENFFVQRPSAKCKGPLQKVQRAKGVIPEIQETLSNPVITIINGSCSPKLMQIMW